MSNDELRDLDIWLKLEGIAYIPRSRHELTYTFGKAELTKVVEELIASHTASQLEDIVNRILKYSKHDDNGELQSYILTKDIRAKVKILQGDKAQ